MAALAAGEADLGSWQGRLRHRRKQCDCSGEQGLVASASAPPQAERRFGGKFFGAHFCQAPAIKRCQRGPHQANRLPPEPGNAVWQRKRHAPSATSAAPAPEQSNTAERQEPTAVNVPLAGYVPEAGRRRRRYLHVNRCRRKLRNPRANIPAENGLQ